ncbi:hypothetical protein C2845_PM09G24330 [Panicum miliaceum]|uniref:Uncharacterized protein n=1 Tax=Panicum miliaceum TaxID=4540 RepID=A0A3L6S263_PANMI|nr:hypothetical protein C2845_PM09G24330 [Panicum miliaceum]
MAAAMPRAIALRSSVAPSQCRFAKLPPRRVLLSLLGGLQRAKGPWRREGTASAWSPWTHRWTTALVCEAPSPPDRRVSNHPSHVHRRLPSNLQTLAEGRAGRGAMGKSAGQRGHGEVRDLSAERPLRTV